MKFLLLLSVFLLAWLYSGYPFVLFLISKFRKDSIRRRSIEPKVSIIICTNNESAVIDRRIENLLKQNYSRERMEVIIVDSSTDSTADIIKEKWIKNVVLLKQRERKGKASAINLALKKATGEVIILSDAPTLYNRDTIKNIVRNFADSRVGGVTGRYYLVGNNNGMESQEKLFWKFKDLIRNLEGQVDSTTFFSGELCAFRKELIEKVDDDSIADDVNIAIKVRKKGYRTIYDSHAKFIERTPTTYKDLFTQKVRRAIGGLQETIRFKNMLFRPRYGVYGMLILPTRLFYTLINPFIFLLFLISFVYVFIQTALPLLQYPLAIVSFLFVCMLGIIFNESVPIKALKTFFTTEFIQLQALIKYMFKDFDIKWEQIGSTRR